MLWTWNSNPKVTVGERAAISFSLARGSATHIHMDTHYKLSYLGLGRQSWAFPPPATPVPRFIDFWLPALTIEAGPLLAIATFAHLVWLLPLVLLAPLPFLPLSAANNLCLQMIPFVAPITISWSESFMFTKGCSTVYLVSGILTSTINFLRNQHFLCPGGKCSPNKFILKC